jgi:hypothetical protein
MAAAVGFDVGHSVCRAACWSAGERAAAFIVPDRDGARAVPACAAVDASGRLHFGRAARNLISGRPDSGTTDVLTAFERDEILLCGGVDHAARDLLGGLLGYLRDTVRHAVGAAVESAVVAVPALWDKDMRARLEGLGPALGLRLTAMPAPVLAVLAAGFDKPAPVPAPAGILVYDLGGRTFTVSKVRVAEGLVEMIASRTAMNVAGWSFTRGLVDTLCARAAQRAQVDLRSDKALHAKLTEQAEEAKCRLSSARSTAVELLDIPLPGSDAFIDVVEEIPRGEIDDMIAASIASSIEMTREVAGAGMLTHLLVIGGSARLSYVPDQVAVSFPRLQRLSVGDAGEMIVSGAACLAAGPAVKVIRPGDEADAPPPPPPAKAEPAQTEPAKPEPAKVEPPRPEPSSADSALPRVNRREIVERRFELLDAVDLRLDTPLVMLSGEAPGPLHCHLPDPPPAALACAVRVRRPDGATSVARQTVALPAGLAAGAELAVSLAIDDDGAPAVVVELPDGVTLRATEWLAGEAEPERKPAAVAGGGGPERYAPLTAREQVGGVSALRGVDPDSHRAVLVKRFAAGDELARGQFLGALSVLDIDHPHVARVLDFGPAEGGWYTVHEYDDWPTLREVITVGGRRAPQGVRWSVTVIEQLCAGLARLHERHVCHRNLKPSNILVQPDGPKVRLADFEHAALLRGREKLGDLVGTLPYMAKEVLERHADHRADLYAAGVLLFELVTGELPFAAQAQRALMEQILTQPTPSAAERNPEVPPALDEVIGLCLEKDAEARFQSADELRDALAAFAAGWTESRSYSLEDTGG